MIQRALQIFSLVAILILACDTHVHGALSVGTAYQIDLIDIDGNKLSTADGHVTIVVLATPADREKARSVGDRVPERCLGNPDYRMITIIRFTRRHLAIGRKIATALVRHRVNDEASRLQARYREKGIARDARKDVFVVTDFDGSIASHLGEPAGGTDFCVFVFARNGELIAQWRDVPSSEQLAAATK